MSKVFINSDDFGITKYNVRNNIDLLKKNKINSISVMVNQYDFDINEISKFNIKIKLHLNLTTSFTPFSKKNISNLHNSSFFRLLFTIRPKSKALVKKEIQYQIKLFKEKFSQDNIYLDSHHHVHMIPWIHNYIVRNFKEIIEIRNSAESLNYLKLKNLNNIKILRNILAVLLLKFLRIFHQKDNNIYYLDFKGLIFSGIINESNFSLQMKNLNSLKNGGELGLHPGNISKEEVRFFINRDSKELCSINREIEKNLCLTF